MGLQVIGAGFGRTGTVSTKAALEILGFGPCYHMREILQKRPGFNDGHLEMWSAYARGEGELDWDVIFDRYVACLDHPTCLFYRELMEHAPEAKVILNIRDSEGWFRSWQSLFEGLGPIRFIARFSKRVRHALDIVETLVRDGEMGGRIEHDSNIAIFERHNREVIESVPAERLLVFDVKQGWEPLCTFLDVEVPDVPFPHLNETKGSMRANLVQYWLEQTSPFARAAWTTGAVGGVALAALLAL